MASLEISELRFGEMGPVTLALAEGECVCLCGPSGGGKSRLLRAVVDLDPHEGSVRVGQIEAREVAPPRWRRMVGYLPAESHWWRPTVGEHFTLDVSEWLARVGFGPEVLGWSIDRLSSGEKQRLALVRLLVLEPEALLLDEPTANLDPANVEAVERLIASIRVERRIPVLWVTHDEAQARRVGARTVTMRDGRLHEEEA